jgi:hypothetical protein
MELMSSVMIESTTIPLMNNGDKNEEESIAPMEPVRFPQIPTEDMPLTQKRNKQTKVPTEDMPSTQKRNKRTKVRSLPPTARPDSSPTGAATMLLPKSLSSSCFINTVVEIVDVVVDASNCLVLLELDAAGCPVEGVIS